MNKVLKVGCSVIAAGAVLTVGVIGGFVLDQPDTIVQNVSVPVPFQVNNTVVEYVDVEVPVNVTVVEYVEDEDFKALACDRLLFDDLSECDEEVKAEDKALALAVAEIEAEFADVLDDEDVVRKDSDVRIIDIKSDFEDIEVVKSNFDNEKYVFEIDVKYEDEREEDKETVTVKVRVEDSEAEILSIN